MGYNTTLVVLNDGLGAIASDPKFGEKIKNAVSYLSIYPAKRMDIPAGNHCNPAAVIETHHADQTTLIAVGGNTGIVLGSIYDGGRAHTEASQVQLLKTLASTLGYRVTKKK